MRRLLLLAVLCMALASVLAAPAMAQSASADPCPDPDFPRETPDGCQASDLPDIEPGASTTPTASASAVEGVPQNCDDFASQADAQDFYNLDPSDPEGLDADGDGVACEENSGGSSATPTATATAESDEGSASASAETESLPETGGPSPAALALTSLGLLVAGGIFATRLVRK